MYTAFNIYRVRCLVYVYRKMNLHYALQTYILFLTFNSEAKPFPFDEWPDVELTPGYTSDPESDSEIVESDSDADDSDIPSFVSSDGEALKDGDGKDLPKADV